MTTYASNLLTFGAVGFIFSSLLLVVLTAAGIVPSVGAYIFIIALSTAMTTQLGIALWGLKHS